MANVDNELRRMREEVYEKPLSRSAIIEFFNQKGQSFHPHLVDTYFEFKHGKCSMDDFLSTLMLIHHHQHIDLTTGFFIELHPLLKLIEHNRLLNQVEATTRKAQAKKLENSLLNIATQGFDSKEIRSLCRIGVQFKDRPTDFLDVSIFTNIVDDLDYTKLNKFNLPIRQVGKQMAISLITKHVECEFMEKMFEVQSGRFELLLESDTPFDDVAELRDLRFSPEFRVQMLKSGLNTNTDFVIGEYLRVSMLGAYCNKKAAGLLQTLYKTTGHAVLSNLRKMSFLKDLMALSPTDPKSIYQNIILTALWEHVLFAMDNDFPSAVSFLKSLNDSFVRETLEVKIKLFGVEINTQITCDKLNQLVTRFINSLLLYSNAVSLMKIENMLQEDRLESQKKNKDQQEIVTSMTNINNYILTLVEHEYHSKSGRTNSLKSLPVLGNNAMVGQADAEKRGSSNVGDYKALSTQMMQSNSEAPKQAYEFHQISIDQKSLQQNGSSKKVMAWKQERVETDVVSYLQNATEVKKVTFNEMISKTSIESKTGVNISHASSVPNMPSKDIDGGKAKANSVRTKFGKWRPFYVRVLSILAFINLRNAVQKKRAKQSHKIIKAINKRAIISHDRMSQKSSQRSGNTSPLPSHDVSFDNSFEAPLQSRGSVKRVNRLRKGVHAIVFMIRIMKKLQEKYEKFSGSEMYPFQPYAGSFKDITAFTQGFKPKVATSAAKRIERLRIIVKAYMTFYSLFIAARRRREKQVHKYVKLINSGALGAVTKYYQKTGGDIRKDKNVAKLSNNIEKQGRKTESFRLGSLAIISMQRMSSSINAYSARSFEYDDPNRRKTRQALHHKSAWDYLSRVVLALIKFKRVLAKPRMTAPQLSARRITRLRLKFRCYAKVIYSFICLHKLVVKKAMAKKGSIKLRVSQSFGNFYPHNSSAQGLSSSKLSFKNKEGFFGYLKYIVAKHVVKSNLDLIEYYLTNGLRNRHVSYVTNAFEGHENVIDPKNIKYHNVANLVRTAVPVPVQVYKANAEEQIARFQKQVAHKIFRRISVLNYPILLKRDSSQSANLFNDMEISGAQKTRPSSGSEIKLQRLSQLRKEVQARKSLSTRKSQAINAEVDGYSEVAKKSSQQYESDTERDLTLKDHPISFGNSERQTNLSYFGLEEETFRLFRGKNEDVLILVKNTAKVSNIAVRQAISLLQTDEQEDLEATRKKF